MIHVCSLAALPETVRQTRASHVLTVMGKVDQVQRPASIRPENHLKVSVDDITEPMDGFVMPSDEHVTQVLDFVRGWDRGAPLVIHCWAGVSRSTASAFAAACALNPHREEIEIARCIRAAHFRQVAGRSFHAQQPAGQRRRPGQPRLGAPHHGQRQYGRR